MTQYQRLTPPADYDAILEGLHQRFHTNGAVRSIPLDQASPPPPDPAPVKPPPEPQISTMAIDVRKGALRKPAARVYVKTFKAAPKVRTYKPRPAIIPFATLPCVKDGGPHDWKPYDKKHAACVKCDRKSAKKYLPESAVIIRRFKPGRTVLPPCTDARGHISPLAIDGKDRFGVLRLRCNRCDKTRKATAVEKAGMDRRRQI